MVLVFIQKTYQTLKTVFDHISKHLEFDYSAAQCFLSLSLSLSLSFSLPFMIIVFIVVIVIVIIIIIIIVKYTYMHATVLTTLRLLTTMLLVSYALSCLIRCVLTYRYGVSIKLQCLSRIVFCNYTLFKSFRNVLLRFCNQIYKKLMDSNNT